MISAAVLTPEWERITLLGICLASARQGQNISDEMKQKLHDLQQQVETVRNQSPWRELVQVHQLLPVDQDILASAVAPEAEPRIGWMFQELQPGLTSTYPTPALMRELFFMDAGEGGMFHARLRYDAPLLLAGLLEQAKPDAYTPVRPSASASKILLGWSVASHVAPPGAVEIPVHASWDDLVLPASVEQSLREFLLWVTHRDIVANQWQGRISGGPVALFSGPSGTGKTFAAEVLAGALGWPLYRVDLGMLVSKYIGETEKNLNALFDAAAGQEMVLLFDEADSLFGKRGEVKEARDRYANMEVSHLLSRIERHHGPCILTSNLRQHMDAAFARRFQMVVEFPRPDARARSRLWRKHVPAKAPLAAELNFDILGQAMQLTGGQIRNVALHAAFLAAGESAEIANSHIARSAWTELAKAGGEMVPSSLGPYAAFLPEQGE